MKKRILIVILTDFTPTGGLTSVMMNYYRVIDLCKYHIDFASTNNNVDEKLTKDLTHNNSTYYYLGSRKKDTLLYLYNLYKLLRANKYDIIHVNGNSATMSLELVTAYICGIKKRIAHTHTMLSEHSILHKICYPIFRKSYTKALASSRIAGEWLFKTNYIVLNNAIDIKKYAFNLDRREYYRKQYNIGDRFVLGTVGKPNKAKNQSFMLKIFFELKKKRPDAVLMIVGGGPLEKKLKAEATQLGLSNDVIFTGMSNDIQGVIQSFDLFIFTSTHEGLGMVLIEAQASGLYCISSDVVPRETQVTDNIQYLSLEDDAEEWVNIITEKMLLTYDRERESYKAMEQIRNQGYDINYEASRLEAIYDDI